MKKEETSLNFLAQFLPPGSLDQVLVFFKTHVIHLTLTYDRKSVLGDYRHPTRAVPQHRISINTTLNPYSFLITLLHELAHMVTFINYAGKASPHGHEWKNEFKKILIPFIGKSYFPADVERAVIAYLHNPAASTCTDPTLYKALYRYDKRKPGYMLVDDLKENDLFETDDGQVFQKLKKVRTRTQCMNQTNKRLYLVPGILEVRRVER